MLRFVDKRQILDAGYWILDENSAALIQHLASNVSLNRQIGKPLTINTNAPEKMMSKQQLQSSNSIQAMQPLATNEISASRPPPSASTPPSSLVKPGPKKSGINFLKIVTP